MAEEAPKPIKIDYYVDLVLRRRWLLIISFCLAMITGIYLSITLPKIYMSDTTILVEPQSIPDKYVEPLTEVTVKERVSTITQQVKSRTYLEQIIIKVKLFSEPEYKNMLLEEKIANVRQNMKVEVKSSRSGAESFTISFEGKDPEKITVTVNELASLFINKSIEIMREEVYAASKFLQEELKTKSENLIKVENALKEYRTSFMGGLPEQLNSNLGMLSGLRGQLNTKQESLRDENVRKIQLESQMSDMRRELESYSAGTGVPEEIVKKEPESVIRLRILRDEFSKISRRYTGKHPDVIKIKKLIADAEAEVETEAEAEAESKRTEAEPKAENPKKKGEADLIIAKFKETKVRQLRDMEIQYDEALRAIKGLEQDIAAINVQIEQYEKRIEDTPKREQELLTLSRDYENIKDSYNKLLTRKLDADIAVSMEMKAKGKKFRVLDSAQVPQKPFSPDIKKLLLMCLAGGLGLGGGLIFLLDLLDTSLRRPEDIELLLGVTVLATIPNVYYRRMDKIKQKIELVLTYIFLGIGFSLFAVFALMAFKNVEYVTDKATKVVTKLFL
ncbi:MAG: hypothetical protein BWK80_05470 [Desulfobacteraceae bacterium IS3]|nr:MAG: hypothetical protein BWK80_05470 [Desulfobacteraceae bacterium IS3]